MLRKRGEVSGMYASRGKDRILTAYLKKRDYLRKVASPGWNTFPTDYVN